MVHLDQYETMFTLNAFLFQLVLLAHFALRKWRFNLAIRLGWIVYALSIPSALLSIFLLLSQAGWSFWMGGWIYLAWAGLGYFVEYVRRVQWRNPVRWSILVPYVSLYLATVMFYWWPLALVYKPLWVACAIMFVASTALNVSSHHSGQDSSSNPKKNEYKKTFLARSIKNRESQYEAHPAVANQP